MNDLLRGPIGDPLSRDPWERAQAQAPEGWHVEGQIYGGNRMKASGPTACLCNGTGNGCRTNIAWVEATGRNHLEMADNLAIEMRKAVDLVTA